MTEAQIHRSVSFIIPGLPYAKKRPRCRKTGHVYDPPENKAHARMVAGIAAPLFDAPIDGPVKLRIWAWFKPAKSWSKKKAAAHLCRPHTQKPDSDNITKAIMDGLNGVAWLDDAQVFDAGAVKMWGHEARTFVLVELFQ